MHNFKFNSGHLLSLQAQASRECKECVVGGLIIYQNSQVFVQKRSPDRRMFPGCWDIPGGHVEPGETLYEALVREIREETGWKLKQIVDIVKIFDWKTERDGMIVNKREFDFVIEVNGDLEHPQIEQKKFTEFRWVNLDQLEILNENRQEDDKVIFNLVKRALELKGNNSKIRS
jgi:mutator protein MutT